MRNLNTLESKQIGGSEILCAFYPPTLELLCANVYWSASYNQYMTYGDIYSIPYSTAGGTVSFII